MNTVATQIADTVKLFADYFDDNIDINKELDKLKPVLTDWANAIDNFDIKSLSKVEAKSLLNKLEFFISIFNRFGQMVKNYGIKEFWQVWNKTAISLEDLFDSLDFYLDTERFLKTFQVE